MKAESMQWVVTITILDIPADRMPHIGRMYTNSDSYDLSLTDTQQGCCAYRTIKDMEMRNGVFSTIIHWRTISYV